jgi:outer membrane protein OmpA-like peptidoglycan-associated protein
MRLARLLAAALLAASALARAPAARADLPAFLELPKGWGLAKWSRVEEYRWHHLVLHWFPKGEKAPRDIEPTGHYWAADVAPAVAEKIADPVAHAAAHLAKAGWVVDLADGLVIAHRSTGGHDAWIRVGPTATYWRFELLEEGTNMRAPSLVAPKAIVETVKDDEDFPFLGHFDGYALKGTKADDGVFSVKNGDKWEQVHGRVVRKSYASTEDVSVYECALGYRAALKKTGWVIDDEHPIGNAGNTIVQAHYAKDGRDLHASILCNHKDVAVQLLDGAASAQSSKLAKALEQDGRVSLYGIYFDVDADALRPESEATLQQLLDLLKSNPKLKLEIQGHTDSTGSADHNQTLSDKRAASVKKWLVDHKVDAARLTTAGLGQTKPVAENTTPEGRAKNRRVELVKK